MSWLEHHSRSEQLASNAQAAALDGKPKEAAALYEKAARAEERALEALDPAKTRTLAASAVSAASLHYKSGNLARVEATACRWLASAALPWFAKEQLRNLLQAAWSEEVRGQAAVEFAPGQVVVSVQGGQIVTGGAPLDLIVDKAKTVQSLFHRTTEFLGGLPHRFRGPPDRRIQEACRPWLFQTAPGSYQFAVAIQETFQPGLFDSPLPEPGKIASCFLNVLRLGVDDPSEGLAEVVPNPDYRSTFLKLTRNLAPTGKAFEGLDVRLAEESRGIHLDASTRKSIGDTIRQMRIAQGPVETPRREVKGILRALHLDRDWLELSVDDKGLRVDGVGEQVDDVIGPLVNKPVVVHLTSSGSKTRFIDIEPDD